MGCNMSQQSTKGAREQDSGASMAPIEDGTPQIGREDTNALDDHGTTQAQAADILQTLRDDAFDSSDEKLAIALGRSTEEVTAWFSGDEPVDADVLQKARALAMERGVELDDE